MRNLEFEISLLHRGGGRKNHRMCRMEKLEWRLRHILLAAFPSAVLLRMKMRDPCNAEKYNKKTYDSDIPHPFTFFN